MKLKIRICEICGKGIKRHKGQGRQARLCPECKSTRTPFAKWNNPTKTKKGE